MEKIVISGFGDDTKYLIVGDDGRVELQSVMHGHSARLNRPGKKPIFGILDLQSKCPQVVGDNGLNYPFNPGEIEEIKYFRLKWYDWYVIELRR